MACISSVSGLYSVMYIYVDSISGVKILSISFRKIGVASTNLDNTGQSDGNYIKYLLVDATKFSIAQYSNDTLTICCAKCKTTTCIYMY